ncbi:response regulator transcription factor [Acidovorax sp.]|jgi:DNA-binding NarL/FixJ family response regulator|uniref:response regulator transcription factor n=1 Tax=Acidovorax sp. TaxID=1872122 RepID=UPI002ACDF01E|nr:response regulator transcription factor [Acidovorax sp.]MDZ7865869.1 response regulator transcription factor [Acidovorax sp.]
MSALLSVLVIEDDPLFRQRLCDSIAAAPDLRLVGAAGDAASGLALLARHQPQVLLLDLGLPDLNGIEVIVRSAGVAPHCEVVVVTVFGDEAHVMQALAAGATGYVLKDTPALDLAEMVRAVHAGGSPISPVIARRLLTRLAPAGPSRQRVQAGPPETAASEADAGLLSERECEMLGMAAKGYSYREIAQMMGVTQQTVLTYVKRSYRKLQVHSRSEAVYEARKRGLMGD